MVIRAAGKTMAIKYSEGKAFEATLLLHMETTVLLAVHGEDEVMELSNSNGIWAAADCERVPTISTWEQSEDELIATESESSCSLELAARLIHMSLTRRRKRQN
jgi:hypothetical protein